MYRPHQKGVRRDRALLSQASRFCAHVWMPFHMMLDIGVIVKAAL